MNGNKKAQHIAGPPQEGRERDAAQTIADWYQTPQKVLPDNTSRSDNGKGFIKALDGWFNELFQLGPELVDDAFWKERRDAVKSKVLESYRNGKTAATVSR